MAVWLAYLMPGQKATRPNQPMLLQGLVFLGGQSVSAALTGGGRLAD